MARFKEPPLDFVCPYKNCCPYLEGRSANQVFSEYQRANFRERHHGIIREEMGKELYQLELTIHEKDKEIDRLKAENKMLHQRQFKARKNSDRATSTSRKLRKDSLATESKKRGAPRGHCAWTRKIPEQVDQIIEVDAPRCCPDCKETTDPSRTATTLFIQEDIILSPKTVVTKYVHGSAWCATCRRQVIQLLKNELPFAPIGPNAKAATLYLRHELKLPYRKIQQAMETLFGIDFVPASALGFEKRARKNADPLYKDLIKKVRLCPIVHADETYWREDGSNHFVWYAGNEELALFHIDKHRSSKAAQVLLGEEVEGLLVTDAYAAYNAINVPARQSCLAHLIRKCRELIQELELMKNPDQKSVRFCSSLLSLLKKACGIAIPKTNKARTLYKNRFLHALDLICESTVTFPKAETLRKRLIPGAREHQEVFAFIQYAGPPTNNHAERALRPLVIFRKVCMGTRSSRGSENISVFTSLTQTTKLQNRSLIDLFSALLTGTPARAQDAVFNDSS